MTESWPLTSLILQVCSGPLPVPQDRTWTHIPKYQGSSGNSCLEEGQGCVPSCGVSTWLCAGWCPGVRWVESILNSAKWPFLVSWSESPTSGVWGEERLQTLADMLKAKMPFPARPKAARGFALVNYCCMETQQEHFLLLLPPLHPLFRSYSQIWVVQLAERKGMALLTLVQHFLFSQALPLFSLQLSQLHSETIWKWKVMLAWQ